MADATAFFVQFPHPGGEHNPRTDEMPWNVRDHRRKFLASPGRYLDRGGRVKRSELAFWGEWEAPSRVVGRWPVSNRLPRALHRPYWGEPATRRFRQNTDPWVFGDRMIYSNCKQVFGPTRRATSMQRLNRGSVICFGSTIGGRFCVDTVFVVGLVEDWSPAEVDNLRVNEAFRTCTGGSVATRPEDAHISLTLYRGATFDDPVEDMFSFVPARRADLDDPRFARPAIESEYINPSNRQSTKGSKDPLAIHTVRDAWESVRDQVFDEDLELAVWLGTPHRKGGRIVIGESSGQRC